MNGATPNSGCGRSGDHTSVAFWVVYYIEIESSPWTGRRLDATISPQRFHDALHVAGRLNDAPDDMSDVAKSRLRNLFSVYLDKCIDHVYQSALLTAATPYGALGKLAKWVARIEHPCLLSARPLRSTGPTPYSVSTISLSSSSPFTASSCRLSARPKLRPWSCEC